MDMELDVTRQRSKFRIMGRQSWSDVPALAPPIDSSETNSPTFLFTVRKTLLKDVPGLETVAERAPAGPGVSAALATDWPVATDKLCFFKESFRGNQGDRSRKTQRSRPIGTSR